MLLSRIIKHFQKRRKRATVKKTTEATTLHPTNASPTTSRSPSPSPTTASPPSGSTTSTLPTTATPSSAASPTTEHPSTSSPTTTAPTNAVSSSESPTTGSPTTPSPTATVPTKSPTQVAPSTALPATGTNDLFWVDLKLDPRLQPLPLSEFTQKTKSSEELASTLVKGKTYAIGSCTKDDLIYYPTHWGLFGCIFEAWKNHWILRTRPEDWWAPISQTIAKSVDQATKNPSHAKKVRELFVSHEGQQKISVSLPSLTIYDSNYDDLFAQISSQIEKNIKVPKYAQVMQNNFGSSGPAHKISSQINLMASMQEFFTFHVLCLGCGLRGLEMTGSVRDWDCLVAKLKEVREILEPIKKEMQLDNIWWDHVLDVFQNLANTRKNPNDTSVAIFWRNILLDATDMHWVGENYRDAKQVEVKAYDGWLIRFLTGDQKILAEHIGMSGSNEKRVVGEKERSKRIGAITDLNKKLKGWNTAPMQVSLTWCTPPIEDDCTLAGGIVGYKVHSGLRHQNTSNHNEYENSKLGGLDQEEVPSVEANHMWAMLLSPESKLRG